MNEAEPQTVRDLVIRSLEAEFGPALTAADVHTWAIDVGLGPGYAAVNVSVNCVRTPDDVNIWIFDPHVVKRSDGARYLTVPKRDTVGDVVQGKAPLDADAPACSPSPRPAAASGARWRVQY